MNRRFDAIIIGADQAGTPSAGRLTSAGMSVALMERHLFGGTCVNTGCIPTKTIAAAMGSVKGPSPERAATTGLRREPPFGRPVANGLSRLKPVLHPA